MEEKEVKYEEMSNSELKLEIVKLKNEYESLKVLIKNKLLYMDEIDKKYNKIMNIFNNRIKKI